MGTGTEFGKLPISPGVLVGESSLLAVRDN